ncbi:ADP-heptose synthase [Xylanibacillus composti]|uniref:ADP-heptose synthase n=1 Tax=Xylanibacillus composti TaxID=1572762 RepID=A0A8J4GYW3_9BACL|nr:ADP-heptose synthase [Xylanibacillus composti]MDT9725662.1 ADP-heptose synthase [Xylanibacillus composti]GIQ67757.1 hypothetical protein XYCOK13_05810 [Xylanibacillus composti]
MRRRFVLEAVMVTIYGQLMAPQRPVEYVVPYTTIMELYDMVSSQEPIMPEPSDDAYVKAKIAELIAFFEDPFNRKKIERALSAPWKESPPVLVNDFVTFIVVNAMDNAQYGEIFDPVETELLLSASHYQIPVLTDQVEFQDKLIEAGIPVQLFDIDDFEYAMEQSEPIV